MANASLPTAVDDEKPISFTVFKKLVMDDPTGHAFLLSLQRFLGYVLRLRCKGARYKALAILNAYQLPDGDESPEMRVNLLECDIKLLSEDGVTPRKCECIPKNQARVFVEIHTPPCTPDECTHRQGMAHAHYLSLDWYRFFSAVVHLNTLGGRIGSINCFVEEAITSEAISGPALGVMLHLDIVEAWRCIVECFGDIMAPRVANKDEPRGRDSVDLTIQKFVTENCDFSIPDL